MRKRSASRAVNLMLMLVAIVISLGIVISGVQASHARDFVLTINLFFWLMFAVTYPLAVLQSGVVSGLGDQ